MRMLPKDAQIIIYRYLRTFRFLKFPDLVTMGRAIPDFWLMSKFIVSTRITIGLYVLVRNVYNFNFAITTFSNMTYELNMKCAVSGTGVKL